MRSAIAVARRLVGASPVAFDLGAFAALPPSARRSAPAPLMNMAASNRGTDGAIVITIGQ